MAAEQLFVRSPQGTIGRVVRVGQDYSFEYEDDWRNQVDTFALSLSMPLAAKIHGHDVVNAFLWGLLPDNNQVLSEWGRRFQVSSQNPFKILEHVGTDCPGAIQLLSEEEGVGDGIASGVHWLTEDEVAERITLLMENASATRLSTDTGQFSLAGAQRKTALHFDAIKQCWGVPYGDMPTTHILKPAIPDLEGQVENEHFCLRLAAALGMSTAETKVRVFDGLSTIVVKRYDRWYRDGQHGRIHQEDFCQALGIHPERKYHREGGPSPGQIVETLRTYATDSNDIDRFTDALIYNWFIAGTDAHGKNYSLIHHWGGHIGLAPLYDIISSLPYPKTTSPQKAKLAMKIGSEYKVQKIEGRHWRACAADLGMRPEDLLDRVQELAERMPEALENVAAEMHDADLTHPVVGQLHRSILDHVSCCVAKIR